METNVNRMKDRKVHADEKALIWERMDATGPVV